MAIDTQPASDAEPVLAPEPVARSGVALRLRDGTPVWLIAVDASAPDEHAAIVAEDARWRLVGRIAYERIYGLRAVLTLTVDDELWSLGLPEALMDSIAPVAAAGGISRFLMRVPASDERLLGLLVGEFAASCRRDRSDVDVELPASRCVVRADPTSWSQRMARRDSVRSVRRTMTDTSTQPYRADYLRPAFRDAKVADVMTPGMITCAPEAPLETVAELMATHRVHAVAVGGIAANHLVWGVIDSLDLVRALRDPAHHRVAEAISRQPALSVEPGARLADAMTLMDERSVAHLVVVDRERPVGVVSTLDIAAAAAWGRT